MTENIAAGQRKQGAIMNRYECFDLACAIADKINKIVLLGSVSAHYPDDPYFILFIYAYQVRRFLHYKNFGIDVRNLELLLKQKDQEAVARLIYDSAFRLNDDELYFVINGKKR